MELNRRVTVFANASSPKVDTNCVFFSVKVGLHFSALTISKIKLFQSLLLQLWIDFNFGINPFYSLQQTYEKTIVHKGF